MTEMKKCKLLWITSAAFAATLSAVTRVDAATLLYSNGFDGSLGDIWKMMNCHSYTYTLVTSPVRSGSHAVKHQMNGSQGCTEFNGSSSHRAQLMHGKNANVVFSATDRGPIWIGFSMYIPSGFPTAGAIAFDIKSGDASYGEPTTYIYGNKLNVRPNTYTHYDVYLDYNKWADIVLYIERSPSANGKFKMWVNGQQKIDYTGQTSINFSKSTVVSYFRTGIYWGSQNRSQNYTLYYDNVKIAKGSGDGYSLVAPSGSVSSTSNTSSSTSGGTVSSGSSGTTASAVTINTWDNGHQNPALATTSSVSDLNSTDGKWTEFYYSSARSFPAIFADVNEINKGLPTMNFYATGVANGQYKVLANLYCNSPMRYFYGFSSSNPKAQYVDTQGGVGGTQFKEYTLGTVNITNGRFDLYVRDADLRGGSYPFFGWGAIRLVPN